MSFSGAEPCHQKRASARGGSPAGKTVEVDAVEQSGELFPRESFAPRQISVVRRDADERST